nr:hypothetical protein [Lactococcus petauri]
MKRQFVKLNKNASIPERATKHSAGYDISASETVTIQPDEIKMVSTAAEFKAVHKQMLEQTSELEKKLATAVKALENIKIAAKSLGDEAEYNYASEALAEIGGEDD